MKVKRLTMRSFRGIDNLTLDFDSNITVLIGNNGVGKSSILVSLSIVLSQCLEKLLENDGITPAVLKTDFKNNSQTLNIAAKVEINSNQDEIEFDSEREPIVMLSEHSIGGNLGITIQNIKKQLENNLLEGKLTDIRLPLAIYYPVNRIVSDVFPEVQEHFPPSPLAAYDKALGGQINFNSFFKWFRNREDLEGERLRDDSAYRDHHLEAIRKAIPELLPGFSNLRVRRSPLRMTVQKQGQELIINQLSDGEKCLLAMVGDLARRLAIANPGLPDPLQGEGVVLIDEIELHLHPKWQRKIIPSLTKTFPNCQFIITTHSPQVVSHVESDQIYVLESTPEGIKAIRPRYSYGRDSDTILEDLMDVPSRPPEIMDKIQKLFSLISEANLDKAKQKYEELAHAIGADDAELVRAQASIRRRELLSR